MPWSIRRGPNTSISGATGATFLWSAYNHHVTANDLWYEALNETPGLVGPPMERPVDDILQYYHDWLDRDGYPFWSFWENVRSW